MRAGVYVCINACACIDACAREQAGVSGSVAAHTLRGMVDLSVSISRFSKGLLRAAKASSRAARPLATIAASATALAAAIVVVTRHGRLLPTVMAP